MPTTLAATGICSGSVLDNGTEFAALATALTGLKTALADTAISMGTAAAAAAGVAVESKIIATKIQLSNRGAAIGVKSLTAGQSVAVNNAVLTRRNELAGASNQFPVPPTPPGI